MRGFMFRFADIGAGRHLDLPGGVSDMEMLAKPPLDFLARLPGISAGARDRVHRADGGFAPQ